MNGKIQGIIVCGVIIACLGGTLAFLELSGKADTDSSSASDSSSSASADSEDESVLLIDSSSDQILKISAENEYGGFTMERPESGKSSWVINELDGINQSTTLKSGMLDDVSQLEAYKTVEEDASDLDKYGLATPTAKFTVSFRDGTEKTFCIGDVSTKSRYRYFCEDGDNTVYMMQNSRISYFLDDVKSFVDTSLIPEYDDDEMPDYGTLTITRTDLDYQMSFEQDVSGNNNVVSAQVMTEPIFAYLNITGSSDTTHGMYGLTAESAVVINPTEKDLAEYGLDEPFTEVTFTGDGYDYDLKIGDSIKSTTDDGEETDEIASYYCYLTGVDGADCIYTISADSLPWTTVVPGDVISLMTANNISDVTEIRVTNGTDVTEYTLTYDEDEEDTTAVTKDDGTELDVDCFKGLYEYLISCPTDDIYFEEPTGEKHLTIEIICSDGHTDTMEFYKESSRRDVIAINGEPSYIVNSKWADTFISNMELVDNGEEVEENY